MRGTEKKQATMLTLLSPDRVVPEKEPLRRVKALADAALAELSPIFDEMSLPRFRGHPGYAASLPRRQSASASFGLRYSLRECSLLAL